MESRRPISVKYVAALTVVSALILVLGALFRPRSEGTPQPPPSETDIARLTRLTQRRSLETMTSFLSDVADDIAPHILFLGAGGPSGVVWDQAGTIATVPPGSLTRRTSSALASPDATTDPSTSWSPTLPAAAVHTRSSASLSPPRRAAPGTRPGDTLIVVWKTAESERAFAPVTFLQTVALECDGHEGREVQTSPSVADAMAGGGLFDLDGDLLGLVLRCQDRYAAVAPDTVDALLRATGSLQSRLLATHGLVVSPMDAEEAAYFDRALRGVTGPIVREVWHGSTADLSGVVPGDIIVSANARPVEGPAGLQPLVTDAGTPTLEVVRGGKRLTITLDAAVRAEGASTSATGLGWTGRIAGIRIEDVSPNSAAATAGIGAGDYLQRVGDVTPRNLDHARRLLEDPRGGPLFLVLENSQRRYGVLFDRGVRR